MTYQHEITEFLVALCGAVVGTLFARVLWEFYEEPISRFIEDIRARIKR